MVNRLARETINDKSADLIAEALSRVEPEIADKVIVELRTIAPEILWYRKRSVTAQRICRD
jgi:hypothetical protein